MTDPANPSPGWNSDAFAQATNLPLGGNGRPIANSFGAGQGGTVSERSAPHPPPGLTWRQIVDAAYDELAPPADDYPAPNEPFEVDAYLHRWPTGTRKTELIHGVLVAYPIETFDRRDVKAAQRTFPGRVVFLNGFGQLEIHPSTSDGTTILDRFDVPPNL